MTVDCWQGMTDLILLELGFSLGQLLIAMQDT